MLGEKELEFMAMNRSKHAYRPLRRFGTALSGNLAFPAMFRLLEEYRISTSSGDWKSHWPRRHLREELY